MSILLVAVLVLFATFQSAFANLFDKHYPGNKDKSSSVYSVFYGIIVATATFVIAGFDFAPTKWTIILGIINGAVLYGYNFSLIKASQNGPFSVTMIFNLAGCILIPLMWSVLHDGIKLSLLQYIFIFIMLASFVLLNLEDKSDGERKKVSLKFLIYASLLFLTNGVYGTIMNTQKLMVEKNEDAELIIITYVVSAVLAFLALFVQSGKSAMKDFRQNKKSMFSMLAASVCAASAVNLLMYCLSLINVAVLYSLDSGGVLIVSVLWSVIALKEKMCLRKYIGLVLALAAVFGLSILSVV